MGGAGPTEGDPQLRSRRSVQGSFGSQLRVFRERAGLSQEALAERAGLGVATLAAIERDQRQRPHPHTIAALVEALGLEPEELLAFTAARLPLADQLANTAGPDLSLPPSNVPAAWAGLIGRTKELARMGDLFTDPTSRLVTVTGTGGVGKTRLALGVAAEQRSAFVDGVWLVELAPLADPHLVPQAVADALGVISAPETPPLQAVIGFLRARTLLLVLDNCEHLIDACADLAARVLDACPRVRLLVTSREPLLLAGEQQVRLSPLALPPSDASPSVEEVAGSPAVQLFVERAQTMHADFTLTARTAPAVASICTRLAGIPLALELAAARLRILTPGEILARLDDAFGLLVGGARTAPTRQQTLRATLDWSYILLDEPERALFRHLAVFVGGCDLEAVETVGMGVDADQAPVLDVLGRLVDKSLVVAERTGAATRYHLLQPVREYAEQKLVGSGEADTARARHALYALELAERSTTALSGPDQVAWLERLDRELGNLRAALRWLDQQHDVAKSLRLGVAPVPFWEIRGFLGEGRQWLEAALNAAYGYSVPVAVRAQALLGIGRLAFWQADLDEAVARLQDSLALAAALGDEPIRAAALTWLGAVRRRQGAFAHAQALLEQSLPLHEALGDEAGAAWALFNLGHVGGHLGSVDYVRLIEDSLRRYRALGDVRFTAIACTILAAALASLEERERVPGLLREALNGLEAVGDRGYLFSGLLTLAGIAVELGQPLRAARLLGSAEAAGNALGATLAPVNRYTYESAVRNIKPHLSAAAFEAGRAHGRTLTAAAALTEARHLAQSSLAAMPASSAAYPNEPLTPREQEVARCLAQGSSDRQVAAALGISVRTASVHAHRLLAKLGLRSRWQVADWLAAH